MQRRGERLYSNRGTVFSAWSVPRSYLEDNWRYSSVRESARVEAELNISTVALRVVGGDENGANCLGVISGLRTVVPYLAE
jgi:hypothetical protein